MSFDPSAIAETIRGLGNALAPHAIEGSMAAYTPFQEAEPYRGVHLTRDVKYGPHERHRLDLYAPEAAAEKRPVVIFVHGGGFVAGDKKRPGTPYQDNVGVWAVRNGMIGINIVYRLAPEAKWPSGAEDLAAVIGWARGKASEYGGDPERIFLIGTSAGAVHVASYVVDPRFHANGQIGVAGAIMLSGFYDLTAIEGDALLKDYFGSDRSKYAEQSTLAGLVAAQIPLMFMLTEFDPPLFEEQALLLLNRWYERHKSWPHLVRLMGHNHYTATLHLNSPDDYLGRQMLAFMKRAK